MHNFRGEEQAAMEEVNLLHAAINAHAERVLAETKLMSALAKKHIRRMAEYPARSAGQKRRYKK